MDADKAPVRLPVGYRLVAVASGAWTAGAWSSTPANTSVGRSEARAEGSSDAPEPTDQRIYEAYEQVYEAHEQVEDDPEYLDDEIGDVIEEARRAEQ
jgi:hypothetical protein